MLRRKSYMHLMMSVQFVKVQWPGQKKLSCNHLFHLACLRSWLDQGLSEVYSCPTCRRPLFSSSPRDQTNSLAHQNDVQISEQATLRDDHQRISSSASPVATFPNQQQNPSDTLWSGVGLDSSWASPWTNSRIDGASTSSAIRSVGLSGVQMMMRQLTSVSENYAHNSANSADASSWNLWPGLPASASSPPQPSLNHNRNVTGMRFRNTSNQTPPSDLLAMVDRVREVLPHMPVEVIILDLIRTNNINITVNNLLLAQ